MRVLGRRRTSSVVGAIAAVFLAACGSQAPSAATGDVEDLYRDQTITLVVPEEPGNSQDTAARVIAEHLAPHLPGDPTIEVRNMPGGGSLSALNFVHEADPDGRTLLFSGSSVPVEQVLAPYRESDQQFVDFDISEFEWIGGTGAEPGAVWITTASGVSNVDELTQYQGTIKAGANRPGSNTYMFVSLLSEVTGVDIQIVTGYESGSDTALALLRNEVQIQGGNYSTLVENHQASPEDVLRPLVILNQDVPAADFEQFGVSSVPRIEDLAADADPETKELVDFALQPLNWGRLMAAPPDTPEPVLEALREAFVATGEDATFLDDLDEAGLYPYELVPGAEVAELISGYLDTQEPLVRGYLELLGETAT